MLHVYRFSVNAVSCNRVTTQTRTVDYRLSDYIIISTAFLSAHTSAVIRSRKLSPRSSV